jgi:MFS family permease
LIAAAAVSGLLAALMMKKLPEKTIAPSPVKIGMEYFIEPFRCVGFKRLLVIFFVWNLGTGVAAVFFAVHMLTNLEMTYTQVSFYSAVSMMAAILSNKPWGRLIDRYGSRPIIVFCSLGLSLVPLIWLIPRPDLLWILGPEAIYAGILWAGFNLAAFNIPLALSPEKHRTIYLATFAVVSGIGFFIASLAGGALAESWKSIKMVWGPQVIVNYHILFVISTVVRGVAAGMTFGIREPSPGAFPGLPMSLRPAGSRNKGRPKARA